MTTTPIANPAERDFLKPGRNKSKSAIPSRYNLNFQENTMKKMLLIAKRTDLDAYTDEELEQALARVLALARGEVLNDAEVQKFWQLHREILRRRAPAGTAA